MSGGAGVTLSWPDPGLSSELYQQLCGPGAPFEIVESNQPHWKQSE